MGNSAIGRAGDWARAGLGETARGGAIATRAVGARTRARGGTRGDAGRGATTDDEARARVMCRARSLRRRNARSATRAPPMPDRRRRRA